MTATKRSLWPKFRTDTIPPVFVLRQQAEVLGEELHGLLEAEVTTVTGPDDFVVHRLDLIAPKLERRRDRILTVTHRGTFYPLQIEAACFQPKVRQDSSFNPVAAAFVTTLMRGMESSAWPPKNDWRPTANDLNELEEKLEVVFRSPEVRAVVDSLIAKSNEIDLLTASSGDAA